MGALEAPLGSQAWFGDWVTSNLLLHFPPLLASQEEVHVLRGHVLAEGVLLDAEIYRNLMLKRDTRFSGRATRRLVGFSCRLLQQLQFGANLNRKRTL